MASLADPCGCRRSDFSHRDARHRLRVDQRAAVGNRRARPYELRSRGPCLTWLNAETSEALFQLSSWYHLLSAPADYAEEAEFARSLIIGASSTPPVTVLELAPVA